MILPELTPISSNQHVQKANQNFTITIVDSSVNVSLKTLIEHQAATSLNTDELTNTFCEQLKNLTSILEHKVNVEQTSRGSNSTSSQGSLYWLRPDIKRLEKGITMKFLSRKNLMIQMIMIRPLIKALGSTPVTAVCSHQKQQHTQMWVDEEEIVYKIVHQMRRK